MTNSLNKYTETHVIVENLFRKYYKVLRTYAYRFVNDMPISENIVQDVFLELWNKRETIDFDQSIKAYLFKSVYHRSLNYLSNPVISKNTSLDQLAENDQLAEYFISQDKNFEYWSMMDDIGKEIERLLDQLPPQCKTVFLLSRKEELRNKEIADKLGISLKAVEKQITKALSFLREQLKDRGVLLLFYLFLS